MFVFALATQAMAEVKPPNVVFFLVHDKKEAKPHLIEKYKNKIVAVALEEIVRHAPKSGANFITSETNPLYAAMIETLDNSVGRVVSKLKEIGEYENTLLAFGEQPDHTYLYHEFMMGKAQPYYSRSLRYGDWKAVQVAKSKNGNGFKPIELYNLKEDTGETKNLAKQYPEIVAKMERFMEEAHRPLD